MTRVFILKVEIYTDILFSTIENKFSTPFAQDPAKTEVCQHHINDNKK